MWRIGLGLALVVGCAGDSKDKIDTSDTDAPLDTGEADNTAPSAPTVAITPADPRGGEALLCAIDVPSVDPDGDDVTYAVTWAVDGAAHPTTAMTLPAGTTAAGQQWSCVVVASDGWLSSDPGSASVTVLAAPCPVVVERVSDPGGVGSVARPFTSIQAAVDARGSCATIDIGPGFYAENVALVSGDVALVGREGAGNTVLLGDGSTALLSITGAHTSATRIEGLQLEQGSPALLISGAASPQVVGCRVVDNLAPDADGAGLVVENGASPSVHATVFSGNRALRGAAVLVRSGATPDLYQNAIFNNEAVDDGGAVALLSAGGLLRQNDLTGNSAGGRGGAVFTGDGATTTVNNNYFSGNTANQGGALACESAPIAMSANTYANNAPESNACGQGCGGCGTL